MTINNPFWEAIKDCVEPDSLQGNRWSANSVRTSAWKSAWPALRTGKARQEVLLDHSRPRYRGVRGRARSRWPGRSDGGDGLLAYLLAQVGVDVVCYDLNPGAALVTNGWHGEDSMPRCAQRTPPKRQRCTRTGRYSFRGRPMPGMSARASWWPTRGNASSTSARATAWYWRRSNAPHTRYRLDRSRFPQAGSMVGRIRSSDGV